MRGLACVLMFQTHCYDSWLSPSARGGSFYRWSQLGGTLPAPLFLFLAVIFRDVIIVIGAILYEVVTHKLEMRPTLTSKATTFLQIALVLVTLVDPLLALPGWLKPAVIWLTFAFTCISGVQYMLLWTIKAGRPKEKD